MQICQFVSLEMTVTSIFLMMRDMRSVSSISLAEWCGGDNFNIDDGDDDDDDNDRLAVSKQSSSQISDH